jgi:PAS domain-containing protein
MRYVIASSLLDPDPGSVWELETLFDQSPVALFFSDPELRAKRTNAAFRRLVDLPDEAIIGHRPSKFDGGMDATLIERILAEQVVATGVPVIDVPLQQTLAGKRRILLWSACPMPLLVIGELPRGGA